MGKFNKVAKSGFMQMSNDPYRDKNLSWTEMGLLGFLMSCNDSFEISVRGLAACNRMGVDATATALNNLIKAGYVTRREIREKGKFVRVEYDYSDYLRTNPTLNPDTVTPYQGTPNTGIPYTVKPDNKNNQYKELPIKRNNNERRESADADASAQTPPKKSHFQKPTVEEIQAYLDEKDIVGIDAEYFWNFYETKGWLVGKSPMKNWKACIATWVKRNEKGCKNGNDTRNDDETEIPDLEWLYDEWKTIPKNGDGGSSNS